MKTVITISPGLWILFEASVSAEHGQVGRVTPSTESEDSNKRRWQTSSSVGPTSRGSGITVDRGLAAVQVLPGPEYVIWDVISAIAHPGSDLALLRTSSNPRRSDPDKPHRWNAPKVNPFAPQVDERVAALGYRQGLARASRDTAGGLHIVVEDNFMSSVGIVREIHEWRRDQAMLPFPCYQVSARFDAGMSGGAGFVSSARSAGSSVRALMVPIRLVNPFPS